MSHASLFRTSVALSFPLALLLSAHAPQAQAVTRTVTNCNNSGAGSLRAAAAIAVSGDVINLSGLSCTRILLTTGAVVLPQNNITLLGRDRLAMTIRSNGSDRALLHSGTGTLTVRRLSVSYGHFSSPAAIGGCIYSDGNVTLRESRVHHCTTTAEHGIEPSGAGGGIYALGDILLVSSSAFANTAEGGDSYGGALATNAGSVALDHSQVYDNTSGSFGGGVYACFEIGATCGFTATYSTIQHNTALRDGGGLFVAGDFVLNKSTVSGNVAGDTCGGLCAYGDTAKVVSDSTISGNTARDVSGAVFVVNVQILNSTITRNIETAEVGSCRGAITSPAISLESTIVSANTCNGAPADIGGFSGYTVSGSHNLVGSSLVAPLPADTIVSSSPGLAALNTNGGPTKTHAVLSTSLSIDRGSNTLGRAYDQRGPGFPRVNGLAPDIGAFER